MFIIKDGQIKIGDKLRVRQWDDMASEFGYFFSAIDAPLLFVENMKYLCGEVFEVKNIIKEAAHNRYISSNGIEKYYSITAEMLEPIIYNEGEFDCGSDEDFFKMIGIK